MLSSGGCCRGSGLSQAEAVANPGPHPLAPDRSRSRSRGAAGRPRGRDRPVATGRLSCRGTRGHSRCRAEIIALRRHDQRPHRAPRSRRGAAGRNWSSNSGAYTPASHQAGMRATLNPAESGRSIPRLCKVLPPFEGFGSHASDPPCSPARPSQRSHVNSSRPRFCRTRPSVRSGDAVPTVRVTVFYARPTHFYAGLTPPAAYTRNV